MFDSMIQGLLQVLAWPTSGFLLLGVLAGLWLGAVPGLGGIIGIVVVLPFTFGMEPASAFALLIGLYAVTATSDSIASIMLGIPGTAASQATVMDGHPMAKKGEGARALGAAITVSGFGGIMGGIALALSLPLALPIILAFGSPDYFLLGAFGLLLVGALSGTAIARGLAAAGIGLLLSQIGYPVRSDVPRYWFETYYLIDGLPLVAAVLGLFALPELLGLTVSRSSISSVEASTDMRSGMLQGVRDVVRHRWLAFRCSILGVYIGMLPGPGPSIADWIAYGHTVQSAKDKSQFGKGDVRGVIGPEATNNAVNGGSLIPTVALGIPGSAGMAILLGAFMLQGLSPGPAMLTTHLTTTFTLVWTLILANIIGVAVLFLLVRQLAKAAFIDGRLLVPAVTLFVFMGSWLSQPHIGSWLTLLGMGALGIWMRRAGWPRPPLVLGFVLGPIMENAFVLSMQAFTPMELLSRPMTLGLAALLIVATVFTVRGLRRGEQVQVDRDDTHKDGDPVAGWLSLLLAAVWAGVCVWAFIEAQSFPLSAKIFPEVICGVSFVAALFVLAKDLRGRLAARGATGQIDFRQDIRTLEFLVWYAAIPAVSFVIGQIVALPLFIAAYLKRWGGYGPIAILIYTAAAVAIMVGVYQTLLHVKWLRPMIDLW
ncbi:tripartite tricarboxylate transporter permease [Oricola sp.]|uniref:tripartite tricarboxylate transporter permease n=1 Tax=Oricola sp. TaxID=1979950 RepID=UPI0025F70E16|nr:tripartite tricarboxylate transporter permease [Oricola sp.]MCI5076592.1 tripartite tricarboxylate transporter permease [Oricola sp.]